MAWGLSLLTALPNTHVAPGTRLCHLHHLHLLVAVGPWQEAAVAAVFLPWLICYSYTLRGGELYLLCLRDRSCLCYASEKHLAVLQGGRCMWSGLMGDICYGASRRRRPPFQVPCSIPDTNPPHLCGTPCLCSPGKYRAQVSQNGHSWVWALLKPPSLGQDPIPNATGAGMATLPRPLADLELCALPQSSPKGPRLLCTPDSPRFQMVPTALG